MPPEGCHNQSSKTTRAPFKAPHDNLLTANVLDRTKHSLGLTASIKE